MFCPICGRRCEGARNPVAMVKTMSDETLNPEPSLAASIPGRPSSRVALFALTISFAINVAFWGSLIYWFWDNISVLMQVGECAVFIVFMAAVHWIGYRLWQRQFVQDRGEWRTLPSRRTALLALTISFAINVAIWVRSFTGTGKAAACTWRLADVLCSPRSWRAYISSVIVFGNDNSRTIKEAATSRPHARSRPHFGPPRKQLCFNKALSSSWLY